MLLRTLLIVDLLLFKLIMTTYGLAEGAKREQATTFLVPPFKPTGSEYFKDIFSVK